MDLAAMRLNKNISIVIPVYNEAGRLADCLQAISHLKVKPLEVLVVDNNSTDSTVAVARQFDFVTILHEKRQGVTHARNRGFDAAKGDIIARIDADTLVSPQWTAQISRLFEAPTVAAVTGAISYYDVALHQVIDKFDLFIRSWLARHMPGRVFLLGANMALRRSAWQAVRPYVCNQTRLHEDLDLAVHLAEVGQRVVYTPELIVGVSGRRADTNAKEFYEYLMLSPQTYGYHAALEYRYLYPVILLVMVLYIPLRMLFRGYNMQTGRFSWRLLMASTPPARVNPATFS
jgi:glycosyltransferase involved in cell wall biosynthesis